MQGKCLCGGVRFTLSGEIPNLYQCHCSLCRTGYRIIRECRVQDRPGAVDLEQR